MIQQSHHPAGPRHRGRNRIIGLVAVLALSALIWLIIPHEPTFRGRKLTSWLEQCQGTPLMETQTLDEAQRAVRAMRADKVWPVLLKLANSSDSRFRTRCIQAGARWSLPILKSLRPAEDTQQLAVAGFEAMGEAGAPALAELTRMLDDSARAFIAVRCLAGVGKPAETVLCRSLTNADWQVRHFAVLALSGVAGEVDLFIAQIKDCLNDPATEVRFITVQTIGLQTEAPEAAIPLLVAALADPAGTVAGMASHSLVGFGTNAALALPALSRVAGEAGDSRANSALRAMAAISPREALPLVLRHLKSAAIKRRRAAAALLGTYERATPEIISALEQAATDPDAGLSNIVARALAKLRHEPETPPRTPFKRGRRLGRGEP